MKHKKATKMQKKKLKTKCKNIENAEKCKSMTRKEFVKNGKRNSVKIYAKVWSKLQEITYMNGHERCENQTFE